MILDDQGRIIWFHPAGNREEATDFRVQAYKGRPALTWWQGRLSGGDGPRRGRHLQRELPPADARADGQRPRRRPARVRAHAAGHGAADRLRHGLPARGPRHPGGRPGGRARQRARALRVAQHRPHRHRPRASRAQPRGDGRWDYLHANSVALDADGNFIVSARQTRAVYKLSRRTGDVLWRLGGKRIDFKLGPGARVRPPARRPPAAGRHLDDLRQQRVAAAAQAVAGDHAAPRPGARPRSRAR